MLRCQPCTAFYLTPQGFKIEINGKRLRLSKSALWLLAQFSDWRDGEEVIAQYSTDQADSARKALSQLADLGLIESDDTERRSGHTTATPRDPVAWIPEWGAAARIFHEASRDAPYIDDRAERADLIEVITNNPGPGIFKSYEEASSVPLTSDLAPMEMTLEKALLRRRTHRDFTNQTVTAQQLATVLHYTFRPQRFIDAGPFGLLLQKTSPSAGARHEVECYVAVRNVEGIDPGLYHYNGSTHSLARIGEAPGDRKIAHMTYNQRQCYGSPFTCFTTAIFSRLAYKYRHVRAYRLWMYDAGHFGQTFVLVCTALGLGAYQTAAFRDSEIERYLGIYGSGEFATYVLGAGYPTAGQLPKTVGGTDESEWQGESRL